MFLYFPDVDSIGSELQNVRRKNFVGHEYLIPVAYNSMVAPVLKSYKRKKFSSLQEVCVVKIIYYLIKENLL